MSNTIYRASVFETNSSSAHSLVIRGGEADYETVNPSSGVILINGDEYGTSYEKLHSFHARASYYAQAAFQLLDLEQFSGYGKYNKLMRLLRIDDKSAVKSMAESIAEEYDKWSEDLKTLKKTIEEHTGCKVILDFVSLLNGYVDHQSMGHEKDGSDAAYKRANQDLKAFLFSKKSYVIIKDDSGEDDSD